MDHLGIQKAHVIGYSMGAQTVAHLIVIKPKRFASASSERARQVLLDEKDITRRTRCG